MNMHLFDCITRLALPLPLPLEIQDQGQFCGRFFTCFSVKTKIQNSSDGQIFLSILYITYMSQHLHLYITNPGIVMNIIQHIYLRNIFHQIFIISLSRMIYIFHTSFNVGQSKCQFSFRMHKKVHFMFVGQICNTNVKFEFLEYQRQ